MLLYQCVIRKAALGVITTVNAVQVVQVGCETKSVDSAVDVRLNMRGAVDSLVFEDGNTTFGSDYRAR